MKLFKSTFLTAMILLMAAAWVPAQKIRATGNTILPASMSERVDALIDKDVKRPRGTVIEASKEGVMVGDFAPEVASSNNYVFVGATNGSLTDMSTGTTQLLGANIDDTASALNSIGFDFFFQGVRFTTFSINDNGVLRLGATAQTSTPYKPLAQAGLPIITAYGADQRTHAGDGTVRFKVTGSAPNRVLTVEWLNNQSNFNTGGTADLTYQVRLYESTGVIEFVYGVMTMSTLGAADTNSRDPHIGFSSTNTANNVGSITAPQSGAPTPTYNGTSNDPTENLYTAGSIITLSGAVDGSRRIFSLTSPVPVAPTAGAVTGVTQLAMTLNWTDNASNETQYAVYRSTDNVNFSFIGSAAENATTFPDSGLTPGTNYFYRVFAVSEGALSTAATFTQATLGAGNDTCNGAGGLWNTPATWTDGSVPTGGDNVTIGSGCTVTIDTAAVAFSTTVNSGGTLQFDAAAAQSLTVGQDVTVNAGGLFQSAATGTITTHVLSIAGNLTNSGTIDFSTNANTAGAGITFTSTNNTSFNMGPASVTDFKQTGGVTMNKGTNNTPVLSFNPGGTITVLGANTVGFLTITNGTFKMDGTGAFSNPLFSVAGYAIPATGGMWMNNANATVVAQNGTGTVTGRYQLTAGSYNVGTGAGSALAFAAGANILIEGGTLTSSGRVAVTASGNAITYNQTAGVITTNTVGNTSTTLASFDLGTGVGTTSITGGTVIIQLANTAASGPRDYRNQSGLTGTTTVTGGTVQFGNAGSGAAKAYSAAGVFPNIVVDNTSAGHSVTMLAPAVFNNVSRDITINTGTTFNVGNNVFLFNGVTMTNNGTFTGNGASTNFVTFLTTSPQTITGGGVFTAPITNFAIQSDSGLILTPTGQIPCGAIRLFSGSVTNANKFTLGNGGATTGVVQIGNTTTPTNAGTFDVPFTFNLGTGGQTLSYLRTTLTRTTGPEINPARLLTTMTYDDNDPTHNLTISGGDLTVSGTMTLTNGVILTGNAITLIHNGTAARTNGYVDGNLGRTFAAIGTYTFFVGQNGFTPVLANVTAAAPLVPASPSLTVRSFDATLQGFAVGQSASRNWSIESNGTITADLSFTYLAADANGNEADYRVYQRNLAGVNINHCPGGPCVNVGTDTVGPVIGVTNFQGRWTAAELQTPTTASADISGRVLTSDGRPIANVRVILAGGMLAQPIDVYTGHFGYFSFNDLPVGENYVLTVKSRRFVFANPSRVLNLQDDIVGEDFVANPSAERPGNK